jgi:thioredoxin-related protein
MPGYAVMNREAVFGFFVLLASACASAAEGARDPDAFFDQSFGNLREELKTVATEGKQALLIMFETEDCPWCRKMRVTVLNQAVVQDYYRKHFRVISLDTAGDNPVTDVTGREMPEKDYALKVHRVRATPVFVFLDAQGSAVARFTGAARDVNEFLWLGEFVAGEHYRNENFSTFKRRKSG